LIWFMIRTVGGLREWGNKRLGYVNCGEVLDQLRSSKSFKKDTSPLYIIQRVRALTVGRKR